MKKLFQHNKKALSEIIGYTILIVIAVSLSVVTYSFLKSYIPKEKAECPAEIGLIVENYTCKYIPSAGGGGLGTQTSYLELSVLNKGLFIVDAAYIRLGAPGTKAKKQINQADFNLYSESGKPGLNPNEVTNIPRSKFSITDIVISAGQYELEIQPALIERNSIVACKNAIITQIINCVE